MVVVVVVLVVLRADRAEQHKKMFCTFSRSGVTVTFLAFLSGLPFSAHFFPPPCPDAG